MTDQPQTTEPVPVQLTRIEGTVNLIAYQMSELKSEIKDVKGAVDKHDSRIKSIELIQAKLDGSSAFIRYWLPAIISIVGLAVMLGFGVKFD